MKFGGSSVADADRIRRVADIVIAQAEKDDHPPVVVVSAMKGITDALILAAKDAEAGSGSYRDSLDQIKDRHHLAVKQLVSDNTIGAGLLMAIDGILDELTEILHGVQLVRECSTRTNDLVSGFGERMSSRLLAAHINDRGYVCEAIDAREIIRTDDTHGRAIVDFAATEVLCRRRLAKRKGIAVVTGFIAATAEGVATTLGRNGSDYTASILGAALDEPRVEIWTDVDGVLTADPRIVPDARVLKEISFQEAMELSFFGAEVIHPYTLVPVIDKDIPVYIRNTLNPDAPGTRISRIAAAGENPITGIASIVDVAMVTIEGGGMVGMPGVASRIFASVASAGVNIIMFTQASSEHSISLVCRAPEARTAAAVLRKDLADVIGTRVIRNINLDEKSRNRRRYRRKYERTPRLERPALQRTRRRRYQYSGDRPGIHRAEHFLCDSRQGCRHRHHIHPSRIHRLILWRYFHEILQHPEHVHPGKLHRSHVSGPGSRWWTLSTGGNTGSEGLFFRTFRSCAVQ